MSCLLTQLNKNIVDQHQATALYNLNRHERDFSNSGFHLTTIPIPIQRDNVVEADGGDNEDVY